MLQKLNVPLIKTEINQLLILSVPLVVSEFIYSSSNFIGTAMVARLGEDALAASVLISTIWLSAALFFFGILNSVSVLISHAYGAGDHDKISHIMGQTFILGLIMIFSMVAILSVVPYFLDFTNQPPQVIKLAVQYLRALLWSLPALLFLILYEQFLAGINRTKLVLRISLLVVPIEIPLIYILIFGKFGLPKCGVAGIGYGFAITYTSTAMGLIFYLFYSKYYQRYQIFHAINLKNIHYLKDLVSIGFPMGLMHLIEISTFAVATFWMAQFGTTFLAAHQIVFQFLGFVIALVFAISKALSVQIGHHLGAQNKLPLPYTISVATFLNFIGIAIFSISFYFFPKFFIYFDVNIYDPKNFFLVQDASLLFKVLAFLLIFDSFRIIMFGALRGFKDTKFPMYSSLFCFWIIGLSTSYLLSFVFNFNGAGIWIGLTLGIACGAFINLLRLLWVLNRKSPSLQ